MVDLDKSASTTTTFLFSRPSSTSSRPKASRVAGPGFSSNLVLGDMLVQLLQGQLQFILGRLHAVEFGVVFHEGDSLSFDRVRHQAGGLTLGGSGLGKRAAHGGRIVAVQLDHVPSERAPL